MGPHSGPTSHLSPCCPSLSWMERKKGQWPSFHILLCPGLLVVLQSPGPQTWRPPPLPTSLASTAFLQRPCSRDQPSICVPAAELFENTDAVFLISASPGPSAGTGRQQLVEWKLEASQSQAPLPGRSGAFKGTASKAGAAGCSLGRDRFCKGFSGGSPLSFLLNTCAASSGNGILIPVKHQLPPPSPCGLCGTGPHTQPKK